jgi:hypothetical protein
MKPPLASCLYAMPASLRQQARWTPLLLTLSAIYLSSATSYVLIQGQESRGVLIFDHVQIEHAVLRRLVN